MRTAFIICKGQIKENFSSVRMLMAFAAAFCIVFRVAWPYSQFAGKSIVSIAEPMVIILSEQKSIAFLFLGYLIAICNAPYVNARTVNVLYRTTRRCWCLSMLMYQFFVALIYGFSVILMSFIIIMPKAYIGNVWSEIFYNMTSNTSAIAMTKYGLASPQISLLEGQRPFSALICGIVLFILYCMVMGLILLAVNLHFHKVVGCVCALMIHFIGYAIESDSSLYQSVQLSLFSRLNISYYVSNEFIRFTMFSSVILFAVIIIFLCLIFFRVGIHADFLVSSGD